MVMLPPEVQETAQLLEEELLEDDELEEDEIVQGEVFNNTDTLWLP